MPGPIFLLPPVEALSKSKASSETFEQRQAEIERRQADLVDRCATLEDQARRSTEFLGTLAHELRNPLAPIRNSLHILKLTCDSDDGLQESVGIIERQLQALIRLIDDVHDASRIARGNLRLQKSTVALQELIEKAVKTCQSDLNSAKQKLTVDLPPEPIYLDGDEARLEQMLVKLLQNAAKFSDAGGQVTITCGTIDGGRAAIRVRDTGIGIEPQLLDKIFELFQKGDDPRSGGRGGLGIGLAIAREIVRLHGGSIEAQSRGPGQGSEFVVQLPLSARD